MEIMQRAFAVSSIAIDPNVIYSFVAPCELTTDPKTPTHRIL